MENYSLFYINIYSQNHYCLYFLLYIFRIISLNDYDKICILLSHQKVMHLKLGHSMVLICLLPYIFTGKYNFKLLIMIMFVK
jgi:hypothetical protein